METLIRLSTAHAKARLSKNVTAEDAHAAIELIEFAYFKRVLEKEKKKRRRHDSEGSTHEDEPSNQKNRKRIKKTNKNGEEDPYNFDSEDDNHIDEAVTRVTRSQRKSGSSPTKRSEELLKTTSEKTTSEKTAELETSVEITEER